MKPELINKLKNKKIKILKNRRNTIISNEIKKLVVASEITDELFKDIPTVVDTLKITHETILENIKVIFNIELEWKVKIDKSKTEYFYFIDGEKIFSWGGKEVEES